MSGQVNTSVKSTPWWKYPIAEICFWLISIFGGSIVLLINAIQPRFWRYEQGDLGYLILQLITSPVGVVLAVYATDSILEKRHKIFCLVNCTIAATFYSVVIAINLLGGNGNYLNQISIALAVAAYIYEAVSMFKQSLLLQSSKTPDVVSSNANESAIHTEDSETNHCESKSLFKKSFPIIALSVICLVLVATSVTLYLNFRTARSAYNEASAQVNRLNAAVDDYKGIVTDLRRENRTLDSKANIIDNRVGIIVEDNLEYYHKYGCPDIWEYFSFLTEKSGRYIIADIDICEQAGYTPHSCWNE